LGNERLSLLMHMPVADAPGLPEQAAPAAVPALTCTISVCPQLEARW
jgi:hypothetical protein